jgi:pimeloyl-ACP methyl ester carboxylesterase
MLISTDVGQGSVVVLLHAFPLARTMWLPQVESLPQHVSSPSRLTLPGFGDSPLLADGSGERGGPARPPSVDWFADAVAEHLDEKGIDEPVVMGGLSMGGYVALAFARRHPHRLAGLISADTKAEPDDATGRANRDKMIALASSQPASAIIESMLPKLLGPVTQREQPEVVAAVRKLASAQKPAGIIAALKALRDRPDATASLANIKVPALVIVGHDDSLTPPDVARRLAVLPRGAISDHRQGGALGECRTTASFQRCADGVPGRRRDVAMTD